MSQSAQILVLAVFVAVYVGMAFGRWPGLRLDRTGIAMLGAIVLYVAGVVDGPAILKAIDFPTLVVLFGLMVLSAAFATSGFYDRLAGAIAHADASSGTLLMIVVVVGGVLSAILANDVVVWAMTPLLCQGLAARGLDPRPYLIGLASAANAGSAATIIGNPQNILIASVGRLEFWPFLQACGLPALIGLVVTYLVVRVQWHAALATAPREDVQFHQAPIVRGRLIKAALLTVVLVAGFTTPIPHTITVLAIAGIVMCSRRLETARIVELVDWGLLLLFAGLFVVTAALAATGLPSIAMAELRQLGLLPDRLAVLAPLSLVGSNTIGNVPLVMLILGILPDLPPHALMALAALSTLAGNLFLVGSLANIITVERAKEHGVTLGFLDHARSGVPITLISMALACLWLWAAGYAAF